MTELANESVDVAAPATTHTTEDLDALLAGYNKSLTVDEEKTSTETPIQNAEVVSSQPVTWQGNPAYFQTGKKAGQLKPNMKHKAPMVESAEISGTLIDGALFIMLIDLLVPMLITIANNKFSDTEIDIEDLQLSEKQKKDLSPLADEVVKKLSIEGHPVTMLVLGMAGIYGINFMAARQNAK